MQGRVAALLRDRRSATWALLAFMVCAVPLLLYMQRDSMPYLDEWRFLFYRDDMSAYDVLRNYNGHLVALTTLALNIDAALFHPGAPGMMTAVSIALQLLLAWCVFVYLRRRIDAWAAAALAALLLIYGSGYEVVAWSFNIGWVGALAFGMAAMCLYDLPSTRRRDIAIAGLLLLSLASCNVGLVFLVWIAIRAFAPRERRRALAIVAIPVLLWLLWYLVDVRSGGSGMGYQPKSWPHWILELIQYAFAGPFGLLPDAQPVWGAPLAVVSVIAALHVMSRRGSLTPEMAALWALPIAFWILTAIGRGGWSPASASRYTYVSFVLLLPLLAELAHGFRIRGSALATALAALWLLLVGLNLQTLSDGSLSLRGGYQLTRTHLTALVNVGPEVACRTKVRPFDYGISRRPNCEVRQWVIDNGAEHYTYSPQELAADPLLAASVQQLERRMRRR